LIPPKEPPQAARLDSNDGAGPRIEILRFIKNSDSNRIFLEPAAPTCQHFFAQKAQETLHPRAAFKRGTLKNALDMCVHLRAAGNGLGRVVIYFGH